jgi:fructokinase
LISVEEVESLRGAFTFRKYRGGSTANIAVKVSKPGDTAAVVSKAGIGSFGQFLKAELQRAGVVTDYMLMDHLVHTTVTFISRTEGTPDFEAFRAGDYKLKPAEVSGEAVQRAKVIHASTFALSRRPCRQAVEKAFQLAEEYGKIISLDPNYSSQVWPNYREARQVLGRMLGHATIAKPSLDDAARLFGEGEEPQTYVRWFHDMGPPVVVLTMGSEGLLLSGAGEATHIPARAVDAVDATGAGDSFWAGFLVALLDGNSLERCALFAREIVERKLTTVGPLPDTIDREEVYAEIDAASDEAVW